MLFNSSAEDALYPRHSKHFCLDVAVDTQNSTSSAQSSLQHQNDALDGSGRTHVHIANDAASHLSHKRDMLSNQSELHRNSLHVHTRRDGAATPAGSTLHLPATTRRFNPSLCVAGSSAWERADYLPRTYRASSAAASLASVTHGTTLYRSHEHTPTYDTSDNLHPKRTNSHRANDSNATRACGSTTTPTPTLSMSPTVEASFGTPAPHGLSGATRSTPPETSATTSSLLDRASSAACKSNAYGVNSDGRGPPLPPSALHSARVFDHHSQTRTRHRFRTSGPTPTPTATATPNHTPACSSPEESDGAKWSAGTSSGIGETLSTLLQRARLCLQSSSSVTHSRTAAAPSELDNAKYTIKSTTLARSPRWSPDASPLLEREEKSGTVRSPKKMHVDSLSSTDTEKHPLKCEAGALALDNDQGASAWWTVDIVIAIPPSKCDSVYGEASAVGVTTLMQSATDMPAHRSTQCRAPVLPGDVSPAEAWELTQSFLRSIALTSVGTNSPPCVPEGYFYFDTDFNQYVQLSADTLSLASPLLRIVMVPTSISFAEVKELYPCSTDASETTVVDAQENVVPCERSVAYSRRLSASASPPSDNDGMNTHHLGYDSNERGAKVAAPRPPGGRRSSTSRHALHPLQPFFATGSSHYVNPFEERFCCPQHSPSARDAPATPPDEQRHRATPSTIPGDHGLSKRDGVTAENLLSWTNSAAVATVAKERNDFPVSSHPAADPAREAAPQSASSTPRIGHTDSCDANDDFPARRASRNAHDNQDSEGSMNFTDNPEFVQNMEAREVPKTTAVRVGRAPDQRARLKREGSSSNSSSNNTDSTHRVDYFSSAPPPLKLVGHQLSSRPSMHGPPSQLGDAHGAPPKRVRTVQTHGVRHINVAEAEETLSSPPPTTSPLPQPQQRRFFDDPVLQRRFAAPVRQKKPPFSRSAWSSESIVGGHHKFYTPSPPPTVSESPVPPSTAFIHGAYRPAVHPYFDPSVTTTSVKEGHELQHDPLTELLQRSAQARHKAQGTESYFHQPSRAPNSEAATTATPVRVETCTGPHVTHAAADADVTSAVAGFTATLTSDLHRPAPSSFSLVSCSTPSSMPKDAAPRDATQAASDFFERNGDDFLGHLAVTRATTTSGANGYLSDPATKEQNQVAAPSREDNMYSIKGSPGHTSLKLSTPPKHLEREECDGPHASESAATHDESNDCHRSNSHDHVASDDRRFAKAEGQDKIFPVDTEVAEVENACEGADHTHEAEMRSKVSSDWATTISRTESPPGGMQLPSDGAVEFRAEKCRESFNVNNVDDMKVASANENSSCVNNDHAASPATVDIMPAEAGNDEVLTAIQKDERREGNQTELHSVVKPEVEVVGEGFNGELCNVAGGGRVAAVTPQPSHSAESKGFTATLETTPFRAIAASDTQQPETHSTALQPQSPEYREKDPSANAVAIGIVPKGSSDMGETSPVVDEGGQSQILLMAAEEDLLPESAIPGAGRGEIEDPNVSGHALHINCVPSAVEVRGFHGRSGVSTSGDSAFGGTDDLSTNAKVESEKEPDEELRSGVSEPATLLTTKTSLCSPLPPMNSPTLIHQSGVLNHTTDPEGRLLSTVQRETPVANGDAYTGDTHVTYSSNHEENESAATISTALGNATLINQYRTHSGASEHPHAGNTHIVLSAVADAPTPKGDVTFSWTSGTPSPTTSPPVSSPKPPLSSSIAGIGGDSDSLTRIIQSSARLGDTADEEQRATPRRSAEVEMPNVVPSQLEVSSADAGNSAAMPKTPATSMNSHRAALNASQLSPPQFHVPTTTPPQPTSQSRAPLLPAPLLPPHQPCDDVAMTRTIVLLGFPGSAWEFIMMHYYERMHEAFTHDSAVAANVPVSAIQDVRYNKGGLTVDLYVVHPVSQSEASIREQMSSYSYPTLWALYEAKKRERRQLLRDQGTSVASGMSGKSLQQAPSTLALSSQEEVSWTGS